MPLEVKATKRVFKFNDKVFNDPNPNMSPEEVLDYYSLTYPDIASAKIVGPRLNETTGTYNYEFKTGISTKG